MAILTGACANACILAAPRPAGAVRIARILLAEITALVTRGQITVRTLLAALLYAIAHQNPETVG